MRGYNLADVEEHEPMNRARITVARMNHFADRHCQRVGLASESSIVAAIAAKFSPRRVDPTIDSMEPRVPQTG